MSYEHVDLEGNSRRICPKCGKEFDLLQFGYPGNPHRQICWSCEPPIYAKPRPMEPSYSWAELDALEDRCLGDDWD